MHNNRLQCMLNEILHQEMDLLSQISNADYTSTSNGPYNSSIGMHIRHSLDHFSAFFNGLTSGHIDYENRQRNDLIQNSTEHATEQIKQHLNQIDQTNHTHTHPLHIREESGSKIEDCIWLPSTYGRELQFLLGHTVHHHAIINFLLKEKGIVPPQSFGVAPSTQRYEARIEKNTTQGSK